VGCWGGVEGIRKVAPFNRGCVWVWRMCGGERSGWGEKARDGGRRE